MRGKSDGILAVEELGKFPGPPDIVAIVLEDTQEPGSLVDPYDFVEVKACSFSRGKLVGSGHSSILVRLWGSMAIRSQLAEDDTSCKADFTNKAA